MACVIPDSVHETVAVRTLLSNYGIHSWLVVWNMAFIFPNSWDDDPI